MARILSKGITLGYKTGSASTYTNVPDVIGIPNLGATPDKVEVTDLSNSYRQYINGLIDLGDLEFSFVYDDTTGTFDDLKALEGSDVDWQVQFPNNGLKCTFSGEPTVALSAIDVGNRVEFTMSIALSSDLVFA